MSHAFGVALTALILVTGLAATGEITTASTGDTTVDDVPVSTPNDFLDLERSLTECISSNPPPGCGRVPTGPGDRGGWQQLALFGVMVSGMSVIFWRVSRAVRQRETPLPDE